MKIVDVIASVLQQRKWMSSKRAGKEGVFLGTGCHCHKKNRAYNKTVVAVVVTTIAYKNTLENTIKEPP